MNILKCTTDVTKMLKKVVINIYYLLQSVHDASYNHVLYNIYTIHINSYCKIQLTRQTQIKNLRLILN